MGRRPCPPRAPLRRSGRSRCTLGGRPDRLPQLHPPLPGADRRPPRGRLPQRRHRRGDRTPRRAHRHARTTDDHRRRRPGAAEPARRDVRPRRDPAVRHRRIGRPCDRRGARLPRPVVCRAHHAPRRIHGHPRSGRAANRRIGPGQERTRAGADFARPRPGGRRRGGPLPHLADRARRPLPRIAAQPARGTRHRPARHQGDFRRDRRAAKNAPEAAGAPGAQGNDGARVRAPALRAAVRGHPGRAGAQGGDRGRCRPQPGRAGRGRRAQHRAAAARHRHLCRVRAPAPEGDGPARERGAVAARYLGRCAQSLLVQVAYSASEWSCNAKPRAWATARWRLSISAS